jgi:hypothetical protein
MNRIVSQVSLAVLLLAGGATAAEIITGAEKVQLQKGKVVAWLQGGIVEAKTKVALPFNIVVETNGSFTVDGGRLRSLEEGDILGRDGMLLKPDGSIGPVMDHITMNRGQVLRADDGAAAQPATNMQLGDGTVIQPDRKVITPSGSPSWLLDGELIRPGGGTYPARDTITMQNGKVMVQKDGSPLTVEPNRTIMMNDGTKVFGDGTFIRFNGDRGAVTEGQVVTIEGVIVRRR